jgi:hypothetical protein
MGDGSVIEEMLKATSQPVEADVLLLQTQTRADAVVAQIVVESALIECQSAQVRNQRLVLAPPDGGVRIKGCPVHQERLDVTEIAAQLIQDAKSMGIDIALVID